MCLQGWGLQATHKMHQRGRKIFGKRLQSETRSKQRREKAGNVDRSKFPSLSSVRIVSSQLWFSPTFELWSCTAAHRPSAARCILSLSLNIVDAQKLFRLQTQTIAVGLQVIICLQQVRCAAQKAPANPKLKGLLSRLEDYPNIPRKKAKFEVTNLVCLHCGNFALFGVFH